jgi:ABC-type antimicrobial peptide transport system permease subunit
VFGIILPPAAPADRIRSLEQLAERLQALPGVEGAALGSNVPFVHDDGFRRVHSLDGSAEAGEVRADLRVVSEDYFRVLDMRVTSGRAFSSGDRAAAPGAAIVNETMARRLGGEVLGRRLRVESGTAPLSAYEIVGIVANARSSGTTTGIWDEVYIPLAQSNPSILWVVLWSRLDLTSLETALRRELRAALPDRVDDPVDRLIPLSALLSSGVARPRFGATLFGAFAATALLLAAIGVFSLIAYAVAQRRAELGLRAALGADSRRLIRLVLNSTTRLVAVGIGLGLIVALYATRWVASQLYGVERLDVPTFLGSAIVMAVVALVAAYVPARRASRVDPMTALRCE